MEYENKTKKDKESPPRVERKALRASIDTSHHSGASCAGVYVASAGPGVPRILDARAVTKHYGAVQAKMNWRDAVHLPLCPDQRQLGTTDSMVAKLIKENQDLSLERDRLRNDLAVKNNSSKTLVDLVASLRNDREKLKEIGRAHV